MAGRPPSTPRPRGYFGIGIYHTNSEVNTGSLFRAAHAFGAHFAFTVGKRFERTKFDTSRFTRHVPLFHFTDVGDFKSHLPANASLVGVELVPEAAELSGVEHPEQAVYLLGAEDDGLPADILAQCHTLICLDTPFSLNVATTGAVVLYDRQAKQTRRSNRKAYFGKLS